MIPPRPRASTDPEGKPRASGDDPTKYPPPTGTVVVNPARAGMILIDLVRRVFPSRKPRASGDDPRRPQRGSIPRP